MSEKRTKKEVQRRTMIIMLLCGIVVFIPVILKLYSLMIVEHDYYEGLAVEQQTSEISVSASRGTIYDRNGNTLAISADVETVFISPKQIIEDAETALRSSRRQAGQGEPSAADVAAYTAQRQDLIARGLAEILEVEEDGVSEKMEDTQSMYKVIRRKVEQDMADRVRDFINNNDLTGIYLVADSKRYYPYSTLASHAIGFVGADNDGLEGVELLYDEYLTGTNGTVITAKNGAGTEMLYGYETFYNAESGNDVVLTIDSTIQYYLEKHLEEAVENYDIQNGAAGIVMDPNTGEILAIATLDNFDLNNYNVLTDEDVLEMLDSTAETDEEYNALYGQALTKLWRNKAVADTYEPGSVFKIITLSVGLEEGIIGLDDTYYCGGAVEVRGREPGDPVHCWQLSGHGTQTLTEAVENSCNVAFVNIGLKIGGETLWRYYDAFGLFNRTGVDLTGESGSIWWSEEVFTDPDNFAQLASASFGQTFNVTPIQLITAVSSAINGGYLMEPYVVSEIRDADGNVVMSREPTVRRQVISEETSATVRTILQSVVDNGTAKNARVPGYAIGGKTGTSEKIGQGGGSERIVSFLGFAPADDPQVAVLVLLDTPSHESGIYISGGQMAAPTVGKIMADLLPYLGIEASYSEDEAMLVDVIVPNVTGITKETAATRLAARGLNARTIGEGDTVTAQIPASGTSIPGTSTVILYLGEEPTEELMTVPSVYGMSVQNAKAALEANGLFLKVTGATEGTASAQSIYAGEQVEAGTVVTVTFIDTSVLD